VQALSLLEREVAPYRATLQGIVALRDDAEQSQSRLRKVSPPLTNFPTITSAHSTAN
jgi:hypothetical protein